MTPKKIKKISPGLSMKVTVSTRNYRRSSNAANDHTVLREINAKPRRGRALGSYFRLTPRQEGINHVRAIIADSS